MHFQKYGHTPVVLLGLDGAPTAGDEFHVIDSEQEAKKIASFNLPKVW